MEDAAQAEASEAPTDSGTAGSLHLDLAIAHPQGKIMKYMSSENTYIHVHIYVSYMILNYSRLYYIVIMSKINTNNDSIYITCM